jgi:hypothetical protein
MLDVHGTVEELTPTATVEKHTSNRVITAAASMVELAW